MSLTVDTAFTKYMRDYVNLDPSIVESAKKSKDNLLENIHDFVVITTNFIKGENK